VLVIFITT